MRVLHVSEGWPNVLNPISGWFVHNLLENLKRYGENEYKGFVPRKVYRKDFTLRENLRSLLSRKPVLGDVAKWKYYPPLLGISAARGYNSSLAKLFVSGALKKLIQAENVDLIHAHGALIEGYLALAVKNKLGIPYVMHAHGGEITESPRFDRRYREVIREVYTSADAVICNSDRTRRVLTNLLGSIRSPMTILAFGVNVNGTARENPRADSDEIRLVTVTRLVKDKKLDLILKAVAASKHRKRIDLTVIGDGDMKNSLVDLSSTLGLTDRVHFLGYMRNSEVQTILPTFDVFVLPAVNEGFGVVYLEAMAAGLPSVGVKGEGCQDIAEKGDCLLLVQPNNLEDLTIKIDFLIEHPDSRERLAGEALRVINDHYSWPSLVREYDAFYDSVFSQAHIGKKNQAVGGKVPSTLAGE